MWSFDAIRERIINEMDKTISGQDIFERIDLSLKCRVEKWLHPAYETLCLRNGGLKAEEIERLGPVRSAAIWRIRESLPVIYEADLSIACCCPSCGSRNASCRGCNSRWTTPTPLIFRRNVDQVVQSLNNDVRQERSAMELIKEEAAFKYT